MYNIIGALYKPFSGELTSLTEDICLLYLSAGCTYIDVFQRAHVLLSNIQLFSQICNSLHEGLPL